MNNICCTQFQVMTECCLHPAAPRPWFFGKVIHPLCIEANPVRSKDPRVGTISKCNLKIPYPKPAQPPVRP